MRTIKFTSISVLAAMLFGRIEAFMIVPWQQGVTRTTTPARSVLHAGKPQRLEDNADGVLYVNDRCINCAACSMFAPHTFQRNSQNQYHVVYHQPESVSDRDEARQAMAACPVAAIRVETLAERLHQTLDSQTKQQVKDQWTDQDQALVQHMSLRSSKDEHDHATRSPPFPRQFLDHIQDVYWTGHHNEASFGATPYLLKAQMNDEDRWIMVDTPKFTPAAVQAVTSLTGVRGPDYLFLTHVDDTAHHGLWKQQFPDLQRIFHSGDLGRYNWVGDKSLENVEIVLPPVDTGLGKSEHLTAYLLNGQPVDFARWWEQEGQDDVLILHTPGHSPGSMTLYRRPVRSQPGIVFTGDSYAYTSRDGGRMTGFPRYGRNLSTQAASLKKLVELDWSVVAPGHGHPRDYHLQNNQESLRQEELKVALEELTASSRRW